MLDELHESLLDLAELTEAVGGPEAGAAASFYLRAVPDGGRLLEPDARSLIDLLPSVTTSPHDYRFTGPDGVSGTRMARMVSISVDLVGERTGDAEAAFNAALRKLIPLAKGQTTERPLMIPMLPEGAEWDGMNIVGSMDGPRRRRAVMVLTFPIETPIEELEGMVEDIYEITLTDHE